MKTLWRLHLACLFIRYSYARTFTAAWRLTAVWLDYYHEGYTPVEAMHEDAMAGLE